MLFRTLSGQLLDETQLNNLTALEIEEAGVHAASDYGWWKEES